MALTNVPVLIIPSRARFFSSLFFTGITSVKMIANNKKNVNDNLHYFNQSFIESHVLAFFIDLSRLFE
jgi:hypothetical protein